MSAVPTTAQQRPVKANTLFLSMLAKLVRAFSFQSLLRKRGGGVPTFFCEIVNGLIGSHIMTKQVETCLGKRLSLNTEYTKNVF